MSIQAINWALEQLGSPTQKHVLLVLANYANESGIAFPSVSTLVADTGLSERAVKKARSDLLNAGLMKKSPKHKRSCFQLCLLSRYNENASRAPKRKGASSAPESALPALQSVADAPPYNHQLTTNNHHTPHKPPKTSKLRPKPKQDFDLPAWVPAEAWNGWLEMRWSMKKPATSRAMAVAIKRLNELRAQGQDPGEVLDNCTLQGWQGIFPIKKSRPHGQQAAPRMSESERNRSAIFEDMRAQYGSQDHANSDRIIFQ